MLGLAIYEIITILTIMIVYLFGFNEEQRKDFDGLFIGHSILSNIIFTLLLLIAGLPVIIYGFITGIKGDE